MLIICDDLHARGIGVRILTGKLSGTYSPAGEGKFFTMMAAFAELERDIIHERTMAGLEAARAQGRNGGRPTVMDADKLAAAKRAEPAVKARPRSPGRWASAEPRYTGTWTLRATNADRPYVRLAHNCPPRARGISADRPRRSSRRGAVTSVLIRVVLCADAVGLPGSASGSR